MRLEDAMNLNKSNHPILTAPLVLHGFCFLFQLVWTHPVCRSFFALFLIEEEREDPPESRQGFEITLARTTGLVSLVKLVFRARASIY